MANAAQFTAATQIIKDFSAQKLTVDYRYPNATPSWVRMPKPFTEYGSDVVSDMVEDAIKSPQLAQQLGIAGFADVDYIALVLPISFRAFSSTAWQKAPDGRQIFGGLKAPVTAPAGTIVHETLHWFGLPDLYTEPDTNPTGGIDLMARNPSVSPHPLASAQWGLDWLSPSQIVCIPGTAFTSLPQLRPIESQTTTGRKAIIAPLSTSRYLTVEARSTVGGLTPGCVDGVVISIVDTAVFSEQAPVKVQRPAASGCAPIGGPAAWGVGSTYTEPVTGLTVTVVDKNTDGSYAVTVQPKPRYANRVLATTSLVAFWRLGEPRPVHFLSGDTPILGPIFNSAGERSFDGTASDGNSGVGSDIYNGTPATTGTSDASMKFDGARWITVPTVHTGANFTLSAWTKLEPGASAGWVFAGDNGARLRVGSTTGAFTVDRSGGTEANLLADTPSNAGVWVHWALVSSNGQLILYRNGAEIGRSATISTATTAVGGQIGAFNGNGRFKGLIDDVAVFSTGLSASQIKLHYQAGITP